jgi:uncharacterized protein
MTTNPPVNPVSLSRRHAILDVMRGIALFGICLANFGEFSLYTFQTAETVAAMPTAGVDRIVRFLQYLFIDGKFYTLFSLLFGIGFSIMMENCARNGYNGMRVFYRRMAVLLLIGLAHLLLLWAGDILILYAAVGMLLPLFRRASDRKLLVFSAALLLFPILADGLVTLFDVDLSAPVDRATRYFHDRAGITEANFPVWLAERHTYADVLRFNLAGSFIRMQELIDGQRVFKVLGIFLLGLYAGRRKIYADLDANRELLRRVALWGAAIGLSVYVVYYAWETTSGHPPGLTGHSAIYAVSVVPLALAYASAISLLYMRRRESRVFKTLAAPGRMALTNYIAQSAFGMAIFYGIGLGSGAKTGLVYVELTAAGVFLVQVALSNLWLRYFRYGPLEWGWRMLTYGRWLSPVKQKDNST